MPQAKPSSDPLANAHLDSAGNPLPDSQCPCCKRLNNCATSPVDPSARPVPGNLSVCFGCGALLVFEPDLTQRLMTEEEVAALDDATRIELIFNRKAIKLMLRGQAK